MTNRKLLTSIGLGAVAYFAANAAGYQGDAPAAIPGTGVGLSGEFTKWIITALAAFLPSLADKWMPGLGKWVSKLLDSLRDIQVEDGGPVQDIGDRISLLSRATEPVANNQEAREMVRKLICLLYDCQHEGAHEDSD